MFILHRFPFENLKELLHVQCLFPSVLGCHLVVWGMDNGFRVGRAGFHTAAAYSAGGADMPGAVVVAAFGADLEAFAATNTGFACRQLKLFVSFRQQTVTGFSYR